jgi:hypothetical protein
MKLILQTLMVFLATLLAAGLVALGEPGPVGPLPASSGVAAALGTVAAIWPHAR